MVELRDFSGGRWPEISEQAQLLTLSGGNNQVTIGGSAGRDSIFAGTNDKFVYAHMLNQFDTPGGVGLPLVLRLLMALCRAHLLQKLAHVAHAGFSALGNLLDQSGLFDRIEAAVDAAGGCEFSEQPCDVGLVGGVHRRLDGLAVMP